MPLALSQLDTSAVTRYDDLLAWWPLNSLAGSGLVEDWSGNAISGARYGSSGSNNLPQLVTDVPDSLAVLESSMSFDGTDDNIRGFLSLPAHTAARTITAWIKPASTSRMGVFGTRTSTPGAGFVVTVNRTSPGNLTYFHPGEPLAEYAASIGTSAWRFIAITFASLSVSVYADATLLGTTSGYSSNGVSAFSGVIGDEDDSYVTPFSGLISDVRSYSVALTQTELEAIRDGDVVEVSGGGGSGISNRGLLTGGRR